VAAPLNLILKFPVLEYGDKYNWAKESAGQYNFSSKQLLNCTHEAEWTPFQTNYFLENLIVPGIEPGPLDLQPGTLTTRPQGQSTFFCIMYINSVCTSQETQYIFIL
jgi:hypothetical protein